MTTDLRVPETYEACLHIDLQKDKKLAILVNVLAALIFLPVLVLGVFLSPIEQSLVSDLFFTLPLLVGMVVYMVLHELVHGIFMRAFSGVRPHYGFTGLYAYAGSNAYFDRSHYLIIALAPVVIWGVVLAVACVLTHGTPWFWTLYLLEALNLSGAAGDLYVTWRFSKLPKDILVQDTGVAMTVYTRR